MNRAEFLGKVHSFLSVQRLNPEAGMIVAYSGGADSGSLLKALSELGVKKLRAVHVMHNLRPADEGLKELDLVRTLCRSLGVPLTVARIRPHAIEKFAVREKTGIEAAARAYRYHILEKCAIRFKCPLVATGHTMDDQLETLLARMFSSAGPEGLAGIPAVRRLKSGIEICRPLLFASRNDVEEYARCGSLPWVSDSSNRDDRFRRNRIRNRLVPLLDSEFPGWRTGLFGTSRKMTEAGRALGSIVSKVLEKASFKAAARTLNLPLTAFSALEWPLRQRILIHAINLVSPRSRLSGRAVENALSALEAGALTLDVLSAHVSVEGEFIRISPLLDFRAERGYFFMIPSEAVRKAGDIELSADWIASPGNRMNFLLEGAFSFPLVVRSRRPGDCIVISGKSVRIDDLIKAWRLDGNSGRMLPVLEDERGIVAVLPDALEGMQGLGKARFRDYEGQRDGRILRINIKGA